MSCGRGRFTPSSHNGQISYFFVPQQALLQLVDQYLFVSALLWVMLFLPEPRPQEAFEFNHNYGSTYLLWKIIQHVCATCNFLQTKIVHLSFRIIAFKKNNKGI